MNGGNDNRPPRGAIAVVAIGLFATAIAAWLSTDEPLGSAAQLEWIAKAPLPPSEPAAIPGGGEMRLEKGEIRITEPNVSGYRLYRASQVVRFEAGSAIGQGRLRCTMDVPDPPRVLVGHTPGSRASYPRSTGEGKELLDQGEVPNTVLLEFNIEGGELASLEFADVFDVFTTHPGLTVSWDEFREGAQVWQWSLPRGRSQEPLELGFATVWRTTGPAPARNSCTVETAVGEATVRSAGELVLGGDQ